MAGSIDPVQRLAVTAGITRWFFDAALDRAPANRGRSLPRTDPEANLVIPPEQAHAPPSIRTSVPVM